MTAVSATLDWNRGKQFVATTGTGHSFIVDAPPHWGGANTGPFNAELLAVALAGCSGMDVVSILAKKRRVFERLQMSTESTLSDERPTGLREYVLTCRVWGGDVTMEDLEAALALSIDRYCIVAHSLKGHIRSAAYLNDKPCRSRGSGES